MLEVNFLKLAKNFLFNSTLYYQANKDMPEEITDVSIDCSISYKALVPMLHGTHSADIGTTHCYATNSKEYTMHIQHKCPIDVLNV